MRKMNRKGLTLIELLIVVLILAALAAIAIPRITASATTAKTNACKTNVDLINSQIEMYYSSAGTWPALADVTGDPNYFPDGAPLCPFATTYGPLGTNHHIPEHVH